MSRTAFVPRSTQLLSSMDMMDDPSFTFDYFDLGGSNLADQPEQQATVENSTMPENVWQYQPESLMMDEQSDNADRDFAVALNEILDEDPEQLPILSDHG